MTSIQFRSPKGNPMRKQLSVKSTGDDTHPLSHTSNRDDVSWSSSDGSTYYSEDEVSLKLREHKGPASCRKKKDNQSSDIKTETQSPPKYRQEKYPRNSNYRQRKGTRRPPSTSPKNERRSLLDNVESFPGINVATGSEDVSPCGACTCLPVVDQHRLCCRSVASRAVASLC